MILYSIAIKKLLLVAALIVLAGCQGSGLRSADKPGYFTWVDDQGHVRQSPIISEPDVEASQVSLEQEGFSEEYSLDNYPDGNELAAAGFVRPGARLPYFSWRDAEGNLRVSDYQPSAPREIRVAEPLKLTGTTVFRASDATFSAAENSTEAYIALGIEANAPSYFDQWVARCCSEISSGQADDWTLGREFQVIINADAPRYRFLSGVSSYQLIRLPEAQDAGTLVVRIRTFNLGGLFVPSLAFLNQKKEPQRIVTDMIAEYVPESWSRHGFLEARVPVFLERGERWLLIFTRQQDLTSQTVVESRRGPMAIPHENYGLLSLEALPE